MAQKFRKVEWAVDLPEDFTVDSEATSQLVEHLYVCRECGAVTADTSRDKHTHWHARNHLGLGIGSKFIP